MLRLELGVGFGLIVTLTKSLFFSFNNRSLERKPPGGSPTKTVPSQSLSKASRK